MPLHEYECQTCEARFDRLTTLAGADEVACARCGSTEVRRLLSVIAGLGGGAPDPAPTCGGGACGNC
jgi:putative FmdB family regulatory protein